MPIYDYHCDHCGHAFSAVQRFADDPVSVCPSCGKPPRRLLSNPALVFKGSGWYKTDSRGPERSEKSEKKDGGGTGPDKGADKGAAGGKTEKTEKSERSDKSDKPAAGAPGAKAGDTAPAPAAKPEKATPASS